MIKINKLRIINWHLFANETAGVDQITFLTGANGTGKSTIIDAMQVVLLGDTTSRNFNKAANDKSTRTLLSYLKGDTGESADGNVNYIRNGRFSSYIALQFVNDKDNKEFTLGVAFDIFDDNSVDHTFFYINDSFPNNDFSYKDGNNQRPCTIKEFVEYLKLNYDKDNYRIFESNIAYQLFLKDLFGDLPDKYFSLFKKAVSFTPISNISSFITEFVCDIDFKIDIEPMKRNIEQYKLLEIETKKIKDKITSLNDIHNNFVILSKLKQESLVCDYLVDKVAIENSDTQINEHKNTIENNNARIDEIVSILRECNNDIEALNRKKEVYLSEKVNSNSYNAYVNVDAQKKTIDARINNIKSSYHNLVISLSRYNFVIKSHINALLNGVSKLNRNLINEATRDRIDVFIVNSHEVLTIINNLENVIKEETISNSLLKEYQEKTSLLIKDALNISSRLLTQIEVEDEKLKEVNKSVNSISSGAKPYPGVILAIKEELENKLKINHSDAKVSFYCDLIDINDKSWTKAIEAAIFAQKFNFFVDEEYFEEANNLLKQIVNRQFAHVSLVDSAKLIEKGFICKDNSIASLINTRHEGARAYTNYLLGNIYKCETFEQARDCGSGLLKDCTGYRSFSTWYLNKRNADIEFIGTRVDSSIIEIKRKELSEVKLSLETLRNLHSLINNLSNASYMSNNECDNNIVILTNVNENIPSLEKEKAELDETLKVDATDTQAIDQKIKNIEDDINEINNRKDKLIKEQGSLENNNRFLTSVSIPGLLELKNKAAETLNSKYPTDFLINIADPFFERSKEKYNLQKINDDAINQKKVLGIRIGQQKSKLFNLRSMYCGANNVYYNTGDEDSNTEYDNELNELSNYALPEYESRIKNAHEKAIKEFRDDFIYKLRTSIETVKSQIDELNIALKDVKFGKDSYRFVVTPNKDFAEYYEMITSDLLLVSQVGGDEFLAKYGTIIEDLFSLISSNDDDNDVQKAQILQNIDKFTDYRTYLSFDLLVKRGNFQVESSLSRTFKKQSGGETQTPFYISILASFAQMYRVSNENNNDTLRIVIFDEAFSKMDSVRIKEVVGLMKSFGLQAILSTPSEKIRDLADSVDTILVTMHNASKRRSYIDKYKEIKKI